MASPIQGSSETSVHQKSYTESSVVQSDWVRPAFDFDGKGAAGGHSAASTATAPATRPVMPE